MQLLIFSVFALILNVLTYHIFICMFTNSRHKIAIGPKFPSPQLFFNGRDFGKYLSCCYAFHFSHYLRWAIRPERIGSENGYDPLLHLFPKNEFRSV